MAGPWQFPIDWQLLIPALISLLHFVAASAVTIDAVLRKRHVPSVIGWVGLAWLAPIIGSVLYLSLGINRIKRKALALAPQQTWLADANARNHLQAADSYSITGTTAYQQLSSYQGLIRLGEAITGEPLLAGNAIQPLPDGDAAFPAMLAAIASAKTSISLATYIFDADATGRKFLAALQAARARGVRIRVLIDAVGARYSKPTMLRLLRKAGIPCAAFLRTRAPRLFQYANLRNHRKILVVDGCLGFVGGSNIRDAHWLALQPAKPTRCLHFQVTGPVVADLQRTFAMDWAFTTKEVLSGDDWFPPLTTAGSILARGVRDGPDQDLDKMLELLLGALASARQRVRIATPYFILDSVLLRMLQVTAMRGVDVEILLPARSNIPLMNWATAPQFPVLLEKGCRIFHSPAPFDHSKLMLVDDLWCLIGSSNWDPRSLRLNFEYNLECYDAQLAASLHQLLDEKLAQATELQLAQVQRWSFATRLRNGLARLLSPYM